MSDRGEAYGSAILETQSAIIPARQQGRVLANGIRITGVCWFGCGDEASGNIGNKKYPKFACGPCTQSLRALNNQCRADPEVRAYWDNIKKKEESIFRRRVMSARVRPPGSGTGVDSSHARDSDIAKFVQDIETEMTVVNRLPVMWMLEDEYVAYHVSNKRKSEADAQAMWDAAKDNPDIRSQGTGSNKRVAVPGVPVTEAHHGQRYRRSVASSSAIESDSAMTVANQRLAFQAQAVDFQSDFGMVGGGVFRRGATAGNTPVMASTEDMAAMPSPAMTLADIQMCQLSAPASLPPPSSSADDMAHTPRKQRTASLFVQCLMRKTVDVVSKSCPAHVGHLGCTAARGIGHVVILCQAF